MTERAPRYSGSTYWVESMGVFRSYGYYTDEFGKHHRTPALEADTKQLAAARVRKWLRDHQSGVKPPTKTTVLDAAESFVAERANDVAAGELRVNTLDSYRLALSHVRSDATIARTVLTDLKKEDVDRFMNRLQKDHGDKRAVKPRTAKLVKDVLARSLDMYVPGVIGKNVVRSARKVSQTQQRVGRALDDAQLKALLDAARNDRLYALYVLLFDCGLRRGEALGLAWDGRKPVADRTTEQDHRPAIDFERGQLTVRQQVLREGGKALISSTLKTEASLATIPMPASVIAALREREVAQAAEREAAGDRWTETGLAFTTLTGGVIDPANFQHAMVRMGRKAGIGNVTVHDARRTMLTRLARKGIHPSKMAAMARHRDPTLAMRVYTQLNSDDLRDAAAALDRS